MRGAKLRSTVVAVASQREDKSECETDVLVIYIYLAAGALPALATRECRLAANTALIIILLVKALYNAVLCHEMHSFASMTASFTHRPVAKHML